MKPFDTHTHYDDNAYADDRDELLDKLLAQHISGFIAIGCSPSRAARSVALAEKYSGVYAAVGFHPLADSKEDYTDLEQNLETHIEKLREIAKHEKVVAIGECGLDYHTEGLSKELQSKLFETQINLAKEIGKPVIIHVRDAIEDSLKIVEKHKNYLGGKAVMHCFSGSAETAAILTKQGIYLSYNGVVTFKNARHALDAVRATPLDLLLLETDCPYLAPVPYRGKRCDSSMLIETANKLAELKETDTDTIINACNTNAEKLFGIKIG